MRLCVVRANQHASLLTLRGFLSVQDRSRPPPLSGERPQLPEARAPAVGPPCFSRCEAHTRGSVSVSSMKRARGSSHDVPRSGKATFLADSGRFSLAQRWGNVEAS